MGTDSLTTNNIFQLGYNKQIEGMNREIMERTGDVALLRCSLSGGEPYTSYEAMIIQRHKRDFYGVKAGTEYLPRSSEFGKNAWSFNSEYEARKCYLDLIKKNLKGVESGCN